MKNIKSSQLTRILMAICTLLVLTSCGKEVVYVVIVVTPTPTGEIARDSQNAATSTPPVDTGKLLNVTWNISQRCTNGGELKDGTVELMPSGGTSPYDISPKPPFSLRAGQWVEVTVKSQDGQTWNGKIQAPSCAKGNTPGGGDRNPTEKPNPTPNPTYHP